MRAFVTEQAKVIEAERRVRFELDEFTFSTPTELDPALVATLREGCKALGIPRYEMASGGGHDAQEFTRAGIPSAMVFVRNANGSHVAEEAMTMSDSNAERSCWRGRSPPRPIADAPQHYRRATLDPAPTLSRPLGSTQGRGKVRGRVNEPKGEHTMSMKRKVLGSLVGLTACVIGTGTAAQQFPTKPMRWICPIAAGGGADLTTRLIAQHVSEQFGQQIVVDKSHRRAWQHRRRDRRTRAGRWLHARHDHGIVRPQSRDDE